MTFKLVIDPMVPNQSKVGNDQKSEKIERDSIECRTINGRSTIFKIRSNVERSTDVVPFSTTA